MCCVTKTEARNFNGSVGTSMCHCTSCKWFLLISPFLEFSKYLPSEVINDCIEVTINEDTVVSMLECHAFPCHAFPCHVHAFQFHPPSPEPSNVAL